MKILLIAPVNRRSPQAPPVDTRETGGGQPDLDKVNEPEFNRPQSVLAYDYSVDETPWRNSNIRGIAQ
jgi:hypothetical protein